MFSFLKPFCQLLIVDFYHIRLRLVPHEIAAEQDIAKEI